MKTITINKFDGGITNDFRDPRESMCRMTTGFDIFTNSGKLSPYPQSETADASASTNQMQNFALALRTGSTYSLYFLGVDGSAHAKIFYKDITTGATNDLDDTVFGTTANNTSSGTASVFELFVYYQKTGLIYGYGGTSGTNIYAYDPAGLTSMSNSERAKTPTGQGLVHSKDDILYIPCGQTIEVNNNGSWSTGLTLPANVTAKSLTEYGTYLAIGCQPKSGVGRSVVYLWDRVTASDISQGESIDWGYGNLSILHNLNGLLVGISNDGNGTLRNKARVLFKYYDGQKAKQLFTLKDETVGTSSITLPLAKQFVDDRLYFMMTIYLNGAKREGVWSLYRKPDGSVALAFEYTPNNDTALTGGVLKGFYKLGDFVFQSFVDNTAFALTKTDDGFSYAGGIPTATYDTTINPWMPSADRIQLKRLISVGATYEALPAAGQVVVKYRVDGGSYTTIFTETTDGRVYTEAFTQASGTQFANPFKEIEFRVESTGNAEVTGLHYKYDIVPSNA